jgi:hypothetical protein
MLTKKTKTNKARKSIMDQSIQSAKNRKTKPIQKIKIIIRSGSLTILIYGGYRLLAVVLATGTMSLGYSSFSISRRYKWPLPLMLWATCRDPG